MIENIIQDIKQSLSNLDSTIWKFKFKENSTHYYLTYYSTDKINSHWRRCIVSKNNDTDYLIWLFQNCLNDIKSK